MKVILLEDVKKLGKKGELIEVKQGYAQNFLIPRKLALIANDANLKTYETTKKQQKIKEAHDREEALEIAKKLETEKLIIKTKCGETGKLYGSITSQNIADEISKKFKVELDKRKIELPHPIKELGKYQVKAKLFHGVSAKLKVEIKGLE
jgi:large subunit ribosomal protein L9